jgi:cell wall-associated NlpC family hydrolase
MIRTCILFFCFLFLTSCIVKKKTSYGEDRKITVEASEEDLPKTTNTHSEEVSTSSEESPLIADQIVSTAMEYSGVRYKYGGTSAKGMDCSGLLFVAFNEHDVSLPRVSYQMAEEGKRIKLNRVSKGDLLFFKTTKKGKRINHVGLVVDVVDEDIKFIHATSSRGVIVSSLDEGFWNFAFVKATRIL